jgi:hypothetical protein
MPCTTALLLCYDKIHMCRSVDLAHEMKSHDDNRVNLLVSRKQQTPAIRVFFLILRSPHRLTHTTCLLYFTILVQLVSLPTLPLHD